MQKTPALTKRNNMNNLIICVALFVTGLVFGWSVGTLIMWFFNQKE